MHIFLFSANMDIKMRQTFILKLLNHIMEPVMYKEIEDIGKNFNIHENVDFYTVSIQMETETVFLILLEPKH